ncbi:sigma-54-dependent transcriptional regulator [Bythopirellula goksoeyrii]|uniref:DNA-binding transcriptional regulator NtrC n=1 Tax=Bythopirellula goksoeyrii TaxID=1400387 RepID=A0A5B9Q8U8_9BACT|nr:sigma-54 dependent transcriptional regulator [Bythopirellula goksoeyrii]QEG34109.1 Nitrogen regulation protein NR(I) [Bythopirellula goksoeyrii]
MARILVVDDEPAICWGIEQLALSLGHEVEVAASAEQGLQIAAITHFDLLLLDVRLPGIDGISALPKFRECLISAPVVVMTAFGDLETAVRAVQNGAFEYLLKPFDLAEVRATINRAFELPSLSTPQAIVKAGGAMLGQTQGMQEVFKRIALAASSEVSVLITGEQGVGKEEAARAIHQHSTRSTGPFVAVNVKALSPTMAEAELFGHKIGGSSDSFPARNGLLLEASGGTLFLDEVADISLPIQAKLIRALDQAEVIPLGTNRPIRTDIRVISSSSQDLSHRVHSGEFRQDLCYHLSEFEIAIPPLRERADDILLLAQHFASLLAGEEANFTKETRDELLQRKWFGNLDELRDALAQALSNSGSGRILPEHLPAPIAKQTDDGSSTVATKSLEQLARLRAADLLGDPSSEGLVYERFLEEVEPALLQSAMDHFSNEYAPAARALGLHRTTLKRKLEQYGLAK